MKGMTVAFASTLRRSLIATSTAFALVATPVGAAHALEPVPLPPGLQRGADPSAPVTDEQVHVDQISPEMFLQGLRELEAADEVDRVASVDGESFTYRFDLPSELVDHHDSGTFEMTLPSAESFARAMREESTVSDPSLVNPLAQIRRNGIWIAIGFNQTEQQMIVAGSTAVLGAAVCAIPGVGWAACAIIGVVLSTGSTWLSRNGICSGGRTLWYRDFPATNTSGFQCRNTPPW